MDNLLFFCSVVYPEADPKLYLRSNQPLPQT